MKYRQLAPRAKHWAGLLVVLASLHLVSCNSNDDNDDPGVEGENPGGGAVPGGGGTPGGGGGTPGGSGEFQSLSQLSAKGADSDPVDDGLDQVQADLLSKFGSADSEPFPVADGDTVETLLTR